MEKELRKIIVKSQEGLMTFIDESGAMRDSGSVKFIYDQKNDAELVNDFYYAFKRKQQELVYDGVHAKYTHKLGKIDKKSTEFERLKFTKGLIGLLKDERDKDNKLEIVFDGKNMYFISNENGSNMIYYDRVSDKNATIMTTLVNFTNAFNMSRTPSRLGSKLDTLDI